ncbi:hypothetical protein MNB_SV-6-1784 [hydrothermal vent metagenome]|uniref:Uncharacterized protein n=1 Tax=hydrothermal vent metagenome TaxID=652676 RepID=A0A1W1BAC9_9ZZZZ
MKKVLVGGLFLILLSSAGFAKDVLEKFSTNGKTYEIYVGYGHSVYVTYGGSSDTGYVKGSNSDCQWKRYGSCKSYSSMISDIKYKVANHKYK